MSCSRPARPVGLPQHGTLRRSCAHDEIDPARAFQLISDIPDAGLVCFFSEAIWSGSAKCRATCATPKPLAQNICKDQLTSVPILSDARQLLRT